MSVQLALDESEDLSAAEGLLRIARASIDLNSFPGYAEFTDGTVLLEHADGQRVVLAVDNRWAASAIRAALLDAGYAVDADPGNETTTVTAWIVNEYNPRPLPELHLGEQQRTQFGSTFIIDGPDGTVEQQCGPSGYNDLAAHARHPFPGASRTDCPRHEGDCWQRSWWPLSERVRHLIRNVISGEQSAWRMTSEGELRMRQLYQEYIHQTRP